MKQEQPRTFWCWLGRTSQIGFAMVLPVVVCTVAASWLSRRYALGGWAVFTGLALGFAARRLHLSKSCGHFCARYPETRRNEYCLTIHLPLALCGG